jgi:hypothetical protein
MCYIQSGITEENDIYVISIGNIRIVKRVGLTLISANPACDPHRFSGPEVDSIRIAGKVVAVYHRYDISNNKKTILKCGNMTGFAQNQLAVSISSKMKNMSDGLSYHKRVMYEKS